MTIHKTEIDGYEVELDTDMDGGDSGVTGCWIMKGLYSASLEALMAEGVLLDGQGHELPVPQATIDEIEEWANENGY
ncbi:hypothetical protein [Cupriavidus necator]